ncbi:hypothetical protein [Nitratireductor sp. XY-223]|uniref:hypothetical protein n=1 Tax=Nitratireductor sp. XY-223 TaxID=2561926 RepID=UPI0010AA41F5|nr:hypothetical protein [Nitratireductor sp. XY-223]
MRKIVAGYFAAASVIAGAPVAGVAQGNAPGLSLELNNLARSEAGCLATFMVKNGFDEKLEKVAFEIVLFNSQGLVERLMVLDFSPLTTGKTRVRQFDLAGADCADISRVLINDAAACEARALPATACLEHLQTTARPKVEFGS